MSTATGWAPAGGHCDRSNVVAGAVGSRVPVACRVHGPSSREWTVRARRPVSSGPLTPTWTCTPPCSGTTSGASRVSSSSSSQPTSSAAWIASSTNAVPGSRTVPDTAWSASQACVSRARWPLSTRPSESASETVEPSSGWSDAPSRTPPGTTSSQ